MKGRKSVSSRLENLDSSLVEELFPDSGGHQLITFSADSLAAIGRIVGYTCALDGSCTFYYSERDNCIGLSVRIAERKRGLLLAGDDIDVTFLEQLANGFAKIYLAAEQLKNADKLATEASQRKKKGK